MIARRELFVRYLFPICGALLICTNGLWTRIAKAWTVLKDILPKGFPRNKLKDMNPAHIDPRNLELDPIAAFGTMGPTDIAVDVATYRLKIRGEVDQPLALSYEEILRFPSVTEDVLLICPGFFSNYGRWTGVPLKILLEACRPKEGALFVDVKGAREKVVRIRLDSIQSKKIFLAYRVNGEPLPQKHGFPLRLVYEDVYGDEWVKYVEEVEVIRDPTRLPS